VDLGTYTFSWESEGTQLFFRSFCFQPGTGFLLGRRIHASNDGSYRSNDLVETYGLDPAGNVTSEQSFGGDPQPLAADPATGYGFTCGQTTGTTPVFQTVHSYSAGVRATSSVTIAGPPASTLMVLDQVIDPSTGLPSSSRDAATVQTTYSYDTLGRPTLVAPAQTGRTQFAYRNATSSSSLARVTVTKLSAANVTLAEQRTTFDALGRPTLEEERMPNGNFAGRRTNYNEVGWKTFTSEQGTLTVGTTYSMFDAFGRPGKISPPDSNAAGDHDVTLTYDGVRQVVRSVQVATSSTAETTASTTELYDRFGRLAEVSEPNGSKTCYEYDAGNRLRRVCQGASGPLGTSCSVRSCAQERLFGYDNRGFLSWENHPEKDANSFGMGHDVDYPSYDAGGNVIRKVDGAIGINLPRDLTFKYDAAERLTMIRETGTPFTSCTNDGGHHCLKTFSYATSNGTALGGGTDFSKGKLAAASRFNFIGAPFNATDEVKTVYEYGGFDGRISRRETSHVFGGVAKEGFRQSFTWDVNGQLLNETYPDCITSTLCGASAPRTVGYGVTNDRLTSVTNFASSITYHANGMAATVVHTNGTTDVYDRDPNWMIRPAAISTQKTTDGSVLWTTGAYLYDGSGNVRKIGTGSFVYDSLSRLTSGTVLPDRLGIGAPQSQSQTFDSYGNITGVTTNSVLRNTPTSTTTNRLSAAGTNYDAAGNLTGWSGNSYEYDAFDQMTRMVSGAEDWRYLYDANDERFWSYRIGGGGSIWTLRGLNAQVLREYRSHTSWANYVDSIFRGNALLATAPSTALGGGVNHLHTDHLGTPRLITTSVGAIAGFHAYYPFGEEVATTFSTTYADRQRFTGHERDLANASGQGDDLDYMHARHFSPLTGRFLSPDPINGSPRGSQSWNRYAYVTGSPLNYIDPQGLFALGFVDFYPMIIGNAPLEGYGVGYSLTVSTRGTGTLFTNTGTNLFLNGLSFRSLSSGGSSDSRQALERVPLPSGGRKRKCDTMDRILKSISPITLSLNFTKAPWALNISIKGSSDGSIKGYIGGGVGFGNNGFATGARLGSFSHTSGSGAHGLTARITGASPPLLGLIGIGGTLAASPGGADLSGGLGLSGGASGSATVGYSGTIMEPSEAAQCE
jgi:RHS repeat-associated protein